jgi:hypothetical protein
LHALAGLPTHPHVPPVGQDDRDHGRRHRFRDQQRGRELGPGGDEGGAHDQSDPVRTGDHQPVGRAAPAAVRQDDHQVHCHRGQQGDRQCPRRLRAGPAVAARDEGGRHHRRAAHDGGGEDDRRERLVGSLGRQRHADERPDGDEPGPDRGERRVIVRQRDQPHRRSRDDERREAGHRGGGAPQRPRRRAAHGQVHRGRHRITPAT